jgi:hypothetical protein
MRISSVFPSKYVTPDDLGGRRVTAVISHVAMEPIGDDERPILYFSRREKGLVLDKTNANTIAHVFGDDTEDWRGAEIVLFETMVIDFQGKCMPAIRCKLSPVKPEPKTPENDDQFLF